MDLITIIGFCLALSGWGKVICDHVTSRPKIRGRIFQMIKSQMAHPQEGDKVLTAFIAYLYLVNKRRNTIHVLDYELEARIDRKWVKLKRVYGLYNVKNSFNAYAGGDIEIRNFENNLIYRKNKPVEYGQPLHGWICFVGPNHLYQDEVCGVPAYLHRCVPQKAPYRHPSQRIRTSLIFCRTSLMLLCHSPQECKFNNAIQPSP